MSNKPNMGFAEELESNLEDGSETINLESEDYKEEILESISDMNIPYEEVLINMDSGHSFIYDSEEDEFEELSPKESQSYLKEFEMEYQNGWTETDLDKAIPGAEAYMFRI